MADFSNPAELSTGVSYLLVNGSIVIDEGKFTGALKGTVLKKGQ